MSHLEASPPQLLLSFPANYPDATLAEVLADFNLPESLLNVRKVEQRTYAAFEWTVPTVVAIYVGEKLIDALIKEIAKEYTPKLLAGVKALAVRCKHMGARFITAASATEKVSRKYRQSAGFSITVQTRSGQHLKMLFDEELSQADWEDAIDGLLATVAANYLQYPNDPLTKADVTQATKPTSMLYVMYNQASKTWELQNDQTLLALAKASAQSTESPNQ